MKVTASRVEAASQSETPTSILPTSRPLRLFNVTQQKNTKHRTVPQR